MNIFLIQFKIILTVFYKLILNLLYLKKFKNVKEDFTFKYIKDILYFKMEL